MKKNKYKNISLFVVCFNTFVFSAFSQQVLDPGTFFLMMKQNHPLVKQAKLITNKANQYVVKAKGAFDPVLASDLNAKYFDGKNYYNTLQNQLKWNSPIGVQVKGGYDMATGVKLNPENVLPADGLMYAGVSVPLGRGMFTDEQRTALKQARLYKQMGVVEQEIELNNLFFTASQAYMEWVYKAGILTVYANAVKIANQRFLNVKSGYMLGDRAAIDTLEAHIQWQSRTISYQQAEIDYVNATLNLSNYVWNDNNTPNQTVYTYVPPSIESLVRFSELNADTLTQKIEQHVETNPSVIFSTYVIKHLGLEQKLLKEYLKPGFNVNYNLITAGQSNAMSINNYKWGFGFYFPLLIRKERANLNLNKIKIQEKEFELQFKKNELANKISQAVNAFKLSKTNLNSYLSIVINYKRLLEAEAINFNNGESSLFLINSRELAFLESEIKSLEAYFKMNVSYFKILHQLGTLHTQI